MTIDERLDRIEHVTPGLDEQWRKDREEARALWRETQRQLLDTDRRLGQRIEQIAAESLAADERLRIRIEQIAEESRLADQQLGTRIEALVSAIGNLLTNRQ